MEYSENTNLYPERGPGRSFAVTTTLEKVLILVVAVAVIVAVGLIISLVSIKNTNDEYLQKLRKKPDTPCTSAPCISEASNLLKSLDMNVDPCTDFYSFACGNWIKNNYLVSSLQSQFTKLSTIILLRVKEILEDLAKKTYLPENKQKTSDFYTSCMDDDHRSTVGATELLSDLEKFGGWPIIEETWDKDFDWADLMIQLFKNGYIANMLFNLRVDIDVKNASRSLIAVSEPTLGLIRREYYIVENVTTSYKKVIFQLAEHLNPVINKEKSMKDIEEAFKIEDKLVSLSTGDGHRIPEYFYNIYTLQQLEALTPKIPWRKILLNLLPPDTELSNEERIMITSPPMIKGLNSLLKELDNADGKRTLANYMFYRVVFNAATYLSKKFYTLILNLFAMNQGSSVPWEMCSKITMELFPLPLAATYASEYMDNRTKKDLGTMFDDLKNSLMDGIRNAQWLDERTKNYALLKARKLKAAIAYKDEIMQDDKLDDFYKSVNITDNHFHNVKQMIAFRLRQNMEGLHEQRIRLKWNEIDKLLTANAYYRPNENSIIIPVGVLQDTIFAGGRPNYINYGSLGMIVGHELTHAFDSVGSLYDAEGSYRMWWSLESWLNFRNKKKCYEKQYSSYYLPEAQAYVNGTITLGENIADNGGLKIAYYAYNSLLKRTGSEKALPGIPYNEKQMFWISFASVWCKKQTEESMIYTVKHSVHTPSQFRVIGTLSNLKEFSEDFNCKLNSPMNPSSKCSLWE